MAGDTRTLRVVVTGDSSSAKHAMTSLGHEAKATDDQLSRMGAAVSTWAKRAVIALGAVAGAAGVMGFKTALMYEQAEVAFKTMLGSAKASQDFLDKLRKFAKDTPFEMSDLLQNSQRLMAMGVEAKKVLPVLTAVGDAVAGMGGSGEQIKFITRALGQMLAKGKVSGEELLQLNESGIKAQQMLADAYHTTVPKIADMAKDGVIPAQKAFDILIKGMEYGTKSVKGFGGMMEKQSLTVGGRLSTLKDTIKDALGQLWLTQFPRLGIAIKGATDAFEGFFAGMLRGKDALKNFHTWAATLGVKFNDAGRAVATVLDIASGKKVKGTAGFSDSTFKKLAAVGEFLRKTWDEVTDAFKRFSDFLKEHEETVKTFTLALLGVAGAYRAIKTGATIAKAGLAILSNPILLLVVGLAGLITWFKSAYETNDEFKNRVDAAWKNVKQWTTDAWESVLKPTFDKLQTAVQWMIDNWPVMQEKIETAWEAIKTAGEAAWKAMEPMYKRLYTIILWLKDNWPVVAAAFKLGWEEIKLAAKLAWIVIEPILFMLTFNLRLMKEAWEVIAPTVEKVMGSVGITMRTKTASIMDTILATAEFILTGMLLIIAPFNEQMAAAISQSLAEVKRMRKEMNAELDRIDKTKSISIKGSYASNFNELVYLATGSKPSVADWKKHHGQATGGAVYGSGSGTSDDVPTMLSTGEHVWTAREVAAAGGHRMVEAMRRSVLGLARGGPVLPRFSYSLGSMHSDITRLNQYVSSGAANLAHWAGDSVQGYFGSMSASGGGTGAGAGQWTSLVIRVLTELRQPLSLVGAVLRRISMESGGNPRAINLWDSNAKAGHPSQGLMQTIPGTFNAYAGPYRGLGILNPLANIYAGLNYAISRYGSIQAIDPRVRPMGYDSGGMLQPGLTLAYNGTGKPEPVGWGTGGITVNVTVEGNVTTERDLVKAITLGVRDELLRHAGRNGGRTGLPPR